MNVSKEVQELLATYKTVEELYPIALWHTGTMFYHSTTKRRSIFTSLFKTINIKDKTFLDLGPGSGDSLDIAKEFGASKLAFVDKDIYVLALNILKGYKPYQLDFILDGFRSIHEKYDVVVCRGSFNADYFNTVKAGYISFSTWLDQLEGIASGLIVLCPTFNKNDNPAPVSEAVWKQRVIKYMPHDVCSLTVLKDAYCYAPRNPEVFSHTLVGQTLAEHGFKQTFIEGFNEPPEIFPFTFIKRFSA